MRNINPQYLVDDKGEKTAALLSIKEYRLLMQRLEDLEDMIEMDAAIQTETDFRDYQDIRADLIKD
jgi:PHD/YefM family antitoxin component YafN of YafNO toxin-antitoxin module